MARSWVVNCIRQCSSCLYLVWVFTPSCRMSQNWDFCETKKYSKIIIKTKYIQGIHNILYILLIQLIHSLISIQYYSTIRPIGQVNPVVCDARLCAEIPVLPLYFSCKQNCALSLIAPHMQLTTPALTCMPPHPKVHTYLRRHHEPGELTTLPNRSGGCALCDMLDSPE